jgi:nitroreductase
VDFEELIRTRRSIRGYRPDPVPREILEPILEAARLAPTAANRQPFQLVVVTELETRKKLKEVYDRDWFWTAPIIIVGCVNPGQAWQRYDGFNAAEVDLSIVMDHVILAAANRGLGTCWICHFNEPRLKDILGIPQEIRAIAMTTLGYPAAEPVPRQRKALHELIRYERW